MFCFGRDKAARVEGLGPVQDGSLIPLCVCLSVMSPFSLGAICRLGRLAARRLSAGAILGSHEAGKMT